MRVSSRIYVYAPGVLVVEEKIRQYASQHGHVVFAVCRGSEAIVRFASRGAAAAALKDFYTKLLPAGGHVAYVSEKRLMIYGPPMESIASVRDSFAAIGPIQSITAYGGHVMAINFAHAKSADVLMGPGPRWYCKIQGVESMCSLAVSSA